LRKTKSKSSPVSAAEVKPDRLVNRAWFDCYLRVRITRGFVSGLGSLSTVDLYSRYAGVDISKLRPRGRK